LTILIHGPPFF